MSRYLNVCLVSLLWPSANRAVTLGLMTAILACASPTTARVIYQSDLSSDAGFIIAADSDAAFRFDYDYSADGIPEAPNSGLVDGPASTGLKLEANLTSGAKTSEIAVVTEGLKLSGSFSVQVDMWINHLVPTGQSGSFELGGLSIGHTGTETGREGATCLFGGDGSGGTGNDYRLYKNDREVHTNWSLPGVIEAEGGNRVDEPWFSAFPQIDVMATVPEQNHPWRWTEPGTAGFRWITVRADVDTEAIGHGLTDDPGVATFTLTDAASGNSAVFGSVDNSDGGHPQGYEPRVVNMTGNVGLVYWDPWKSVSPDPSLSFGIFDNLIITAPLDVQAGDADQDLDFDQFDLVQVQVAAKYLSGQPATWGEGDWNGAPGGEPGNPPTGDGRFDQLDIVAALAPAHYLTGPYAAVAGGGVKGDGQTSIIYDPGTGELALDASSVTDLTSINIDSAAGIFTGDAAQNLDGSFDDDADNNIFKASIVTDDPLLFGNGFGSVTFGNVAVAGFPEEFVRNDLTVIGSLAGGGDVGTVDLIYIPEPSTFVLLGLALAGIVVVRIRRQSSLNRRPY